MYQLANVLMNTDLDILLHNLHIDKSSNQLVEYGSSCII